MNAFIQLLTWLLSPMPAPWEKPGTQNAVTTTSVAALTASTAILPVVYTFLQKLGPIHFIRSATLSDIWMLSPLVGICILSLVLRSVGAKGLNSAVNTLGWLARAGAMTLLFLAFAASLLAHQNVDYNEAWASPFAVGLICAALICALLCFSFTDSSVKPWYIILSAVLYLSLVVLVLDLNLIGLDNPWYQYNPPLPDLMNKESN